MIIPRNPLSLEWRPQGSRIGFGCALLFHAVMALAWGLAQMPFAVAAAVALLWCFSLYRLWRTRRQPVCAGLRYREGSWQWQQGKSWLPVQRLPGGIVTPWLILVRFRVQGRQRSLLLWPDSADADALRRLRVLLLSQRDD